MALIDALKLFETTPHCCANLREKNRRSASFNFSDVISYFMCFRLALWFGHFFILCFVLFLFPEFTSLTRMLDL